MIFNSYEEKILKLLTKKRRRMTINAIAKETKCSRVTIKKYIKKLREKGFIERKGKKWGFKFRLLKEEKSKK